MLLFHVKPAMPLRTHLTFQLLNSSLHIGTSKFKVQVPRLCYPRQVSDTSKRGLSRPVNMLAI